jgi:phosphoserine aminotransferase
VSTVFNFAAGPGVMPAEVLARAQAEFVSWRGTGGSILEMPFTGAEFKSILAATEERLRGLLGIPANYTVLFTQGGASAQFSLVPLNLLGRKGSADYVETGYWSCRAIAEAARYCEVRLAASSANTQFDRIPTQADWRLHSDAAFCHITSNETADGLEYHWMPDIGEVPLVADMTSDFLSRPLDVSRYGVIYASAQKNIGPAGLTIVIVRGDLLGRARPETPQTFTYAVQARADGPFNTPATFAIYIAGLVFEWLERQGGLAAIERLNCRKSAKLYAALDCSEGFYQSRVRPADRSRTTACFTLRDSALTAEFLRQAAERGLRHLAGHAASGGLRAAMYNAMPEQGVDALAAFMDGFARAHG